MTPDSQNRSPAVEYVQKEVSFGTCSNNFIGELEKEMLIPNNVNIWGQIKGTSSLKGYKLRLEFPKEANVAFIKPPSSHIFEGDKRILMYNLEDVLYYDDYTWWLLKEQASFYLQLNLLPPFPELNLLDLQISCSPHTTVGLEAEVTTRIHMKAQKPLNTLLLTLNAPMRPMPGVKVILSGFSGDQITVPRQTITMPAKAYPFPQLNLNAGEELAYEVKSLITADPSNMSFLKCETDILGSKLIAMSESTPSGPPCGVAILDDRGQELQVLKTLRSNVYQANAQVMYSPFSIRRETAVEVHAQ